MNQTPNKLGRKKGTQLDVCRKTKTNKANATATKSHDAALGGLDNHIHACKSSHDNNNKVTTQISLAVASARMLTAASNYTFYLRADSKLLTNHCTAF